MVSTRDGPIYVTGEEKMGSCVGGGGGGDGGDGGSGGGDGGSGDDDGGGGGGGGDNVNDSKYSRSIRMIMLPRFFFKGQPYRAASLPPLRFPRIILFFSQNYGSTLFSTARQPNALKC